MPYYYHLRRIPTEPSPKRVDAIKKLRAMTGAELKIAADITYEIGSFSLNTPISNEDVKEFVTFGYQVYNGLTATDMLREPPDPVVDPNTKPEAEPTHLEIFTAGLTLAGISWEWVDADCESCYIVGVESTDSEESIWLYFSKDTGEFKQSVI